MLKVSDLVTHYGHSQALFGIDFSIEAGEVATLLGRNGMGKTTTIHSVMGILSKTSGQVLFDETDITAWPSYKVAKLGIGLVPEGRQIFPNLTTHENLIATARGSETGAWTAERIYDLFPELAQRKQSMGNLLSGGEQQMLAIGRALMTNPKLMILDEATEGLAPLIRQKIWESFDRIRQGGLSILVVDKNLKDLMKLADRHHIVHRGKVVWSGTSEALDRAQDVRDTYLGL